MENLNCPNCGAECPIFLKVAKVVTCPSCNTTLVVNGAHIATAGEQGVMHDAPLLFGVGDQVVLGGVSITITGHARYSYGRGFWDEFCGFGGDGAVYWISVDEGDVVKQVGIPVEKAPRFAPPFKPGDTLEFGSADYTVTEVETAECIALRGQFDEVLQIGERHEFVNASTGDAKLLSGEFWSGNVRWYLGHWHDPFGVKVIVQE